MIAARLPTFRVEKPWGVTELPPPFSSDGNERIGEIWFDPPDAYPLLVKYLFTSERLSIQVHPDDRQARLRGLAIGKEECWYVLAAEPDARLGIGTVRPLDRRALLGAAQSGELEQLMQWHQVTAGMFFHIPPGTVHAVGGGVTLIEIQQYSEVTYRLFDYGRPRPLHLDDGTAVACAEPMSAERAQVVNAATSSRLLDSEHLGVAHVVGRDRAPLADGPGKGMIIPLEGQVSVDDILAVPGECLWIADVNALAVDENARFLFGWLKG
jgi:mannose-6-phosphate isomerase